MGFQHLASAVWNSVPSTGLECIQWLRTHFFTQPTLSHSNDLTHAVCLLLPPLLLKICRQTVTDTVKHTHTRLTALCPGLPGWAGTRKVKPIWILLKQETVSGSAISWAICKSAPRSRQTTMPARHHSVFYRPDALPATQATASKHRRQITNTVKRL